MPKHWRDIGRIRRAKAQALYIPLQRCLSRILNYYLRDEDEEDFEPVPMEELIKFIKNFQSLNSLTVDISSPAQDALIYKQLPPAITSHAQNLRSLLIHYSGEDPMDNVFKDAARQCQELRCLALSTSWENVVPFCSVSSNA